MSELHRYPYTVRFHDTDPAGIVFFAHFFRIAHEAYESWLEAMGLDLASFVTGSRAGLPIAHASAHYHVPLRLGEHAVIEVACRRVGHTSFTLGYRVLGGAGDLCAELETVHVYVDAATRKPAPLPAEILAALNG